MKFFVSSWGANNQPIVVNSGVNWAGVGGVATVGTQNVSSAEFTVSGSVSATAAEAVKVDVGNVSCTAKILVLSDAAVGAGSVRATVVDELSGRPITGATVWVTNGATGAHLGAEDTAVGGVATVTATLSGPVSVTVLHNDYTYVTVANYDPAGSRDLFFALRRNQLDKYGGYKGTFQGGTEATGTAQLGIAGMSLPGSITDLSVDQLLGPTQNKPLDIGGGIPKQDSVPFPAGVYMRFSDKDVKTDILGLGLAGSCVGASESDIQDGKCGTRTAWGLSGDVEPEELPIPELVSGFTGGGQINFGNVLAKIIPVLRKFHSSVVRDVKFTLQATPLQGDVPNLKNLTEGQMSHFTATNHSYAQMPLGFNFVVNAPALPKFKQKYVDGLLLLGGANVRGRGVVPLGLGAGVNADPVEDGKTDVQSGLSGPGLVTLRMAPTHNGLEGSDYAVVALAASFAGLSDSTAGLASSGIFHRIAENKLRFDPEGTTHKVDLQGGFLPIPENAKYNFTDVADGSLAARTLLFTTAPALTEASLVQAIFTDAAEHRWAVLFDAATLNGSTRIKLPDPALVPAKSFKDRSFANGNKATGRRSRLTVQALKLHSNPGGTGTPVSFTNLVENNGTNGDRLLDLTSGFSVLDYAAPTIAWQLPTETEKNIAAGAQVKLKVTYFKIGTGASDDGVVRLTLTGGTAACQPGSPLEGSVESSAGKGEILIQLPAGCTGTVGMEAKLFKNGNPIAPPVSSSLSGVVIQ